MDQDILSITNYETIIFKPTTLISPYTNKPSNGAPLNENRVTFWCEVCTKPFEGVVIVYQHLKGKYHVKKVKQIEEGCIEGSKTKIGEKRRQKDETRSPIKKPKKDVESKKVESKKVESKKVESKKVDSKKVDSKKVDSKKVDNKKVDNKKVESKKVESKKVESKKVESKSQSTVNEDTLRCEDCDLKFASAVAAITHFKGKRHMKMIVAKAKPKQNVRGEQGKGQRNGFVLSNDLKNMPNEKVGSQHQSNQYYSGGRQPGNQEERSLNEYGWNY